MRESRTESGCLNSLMEQSLPSGVIKGREKRGKRDRCFGGKLSVIRPSSADFHFLSFSVSISSCVMRPPFRIGSPCAPNRRLVVARARARVCVCVYIIHNIYTHDIVVNIYKNNIRDQRILTEKTNCYTLQYAYS